MSSSLVLTRKYRHRVPESHRVNLDTRIAWLWNQRFGTVQTIWQVSGAPNGDILDHTATTLIIQAIMGRDLESITQLFQRLEGGPMKDDQLIDEETIRV